jgi:hypothetical protein
LKKAIIKRRATPTIYVLGVNRPGYFAGPRYCKAHIRNKKGYVYLQWKDDTEVRSFYLGKAPRSSTTEPAAAARPARAPGGRSGRVRKRAKVGQKSRRTRKAIKRKRNR